MNDNDDADVFLGTGVAVCVLSLFSGFCMDVMPRRWTMSFLFLIIDIQGDLGYLGKDWLAGELAVRPITLPLQPT